MCVSCMYIIRILVQHMDEFASQAKTLQAHIPSSYSAKMATKSEGVSNHAETCIFTLFMC